MRGAIFASPGTILLGSGAIAVQDFWRLKLSHGSKPGRRRLRSVAVQNMVGIGIVSWYRFYWRADARIMA